MNETNKEVIKSLVNFNENSIQVILKLNKFYNSMPSMKSWINNINENLPETLNEDDGFIKFIKDNYFLISNEEEEEETVKIFKILLNHSNYTYNRHLKQKCLSHYADEDEDHDEKHICKSNSGTSLNTSSSFSTNTSTTSTLINNYDSKYWFKNFKKFEIDLFLNNFLDKISNINSKRYTTRSSIKKKM